MKSKLCGWAGCNCLTDGSYYCAKHKAIADKRREEQKKQYKPFANATRFTNRYQTNEWRRFRAALIKERGWCEHCGSSIGLSVHHIVGVRYAPERFLDKTNCVVLCSSCHAVETQREIMLRKHSR